MPKPPPRDPGAPKRNQSAYLLYQNAMRETFKAQNPGMSFGQLSKYTSAMYAEMHPSEKEAWVQRAEADKQRYLHELQYYNPPDGYDAKGDALPGSFPPPSSTAGPRSYKGLQKDPNAPKKNMSAYLLYQNAMRDTFKAQFPAMTFGQIATHTSQQYHALSTEERQHWEDLATSDKVRYHEEMANYDPPPGYDKTGVMIGSKDAGPRKYTKKPKDPNAPKRARGSFVFFTFEMRPQICQEFPGIKFTELGHVMGERWRALTPEQKCKYEEMAADDKKRFQEETQAYNASKALYPSSTARATAEYDYNSAPPPPQAQIYGTHPGAEHDPNYAHHHHYYQGHYDPGAAYQQMEYYSHMGYPPHPPAYPPHPPAYPHPPPPPPFAGHPGQPPDVPGNQNEHEKQI